MIGVNCIIPETQFAHHLDFITNSIVSKTKFKLYYRLTADHLLSV